MIAKIMIVFISQTPGYDFLIYSPDLEKIADYFKEVSKIQEIHIGKVICDTSSNYFKILKTKSVIFIGTHSSKFLKNSFFQKDFPFKFKKDTVYLKDTTIVADDYVFTARSKSPFNEEKELCLIIGNRKKDVLAFYYPSHIGEFNINRTRNGMMYEDELVCKGKIKRNKDKFIIKEIKYFKPVVPENLNIFISDPIKLFWDSNLLNKDEAKKFLNLMKTMYDAYKIQYNLIMPDTIYVYLSLSPSYKRVRFNLYSEPFGIIWAKMGNREEFLSNSHLVVSFAHEFARITFQPSISDPEKRYPLSLGADDWSDYSPTVGVVPYIYEKLGKDGWFGKDDYIKYGIPFFERWYKGAYNTFAWILYEIDKKYGKGFIGRVINRVKNYKFYGLPDMYYFMEELARETKDKDIIRKVKKAFPTPLEHSLWRRHKWKHFGFYPYLDEMFLEHNFKIDSVEKFSQADSVGLKKGDIIVEIDGFNLDKNKADCYKNLLFKKFGDRIEIKVKRNKKSLKFDLKIKERR